MRSLRHTPGLKSSATRRSGRNTHHPRRNISCRRPLIKRSHTCTTILSKSVPFICVNRRVFSSSPPPPSSSPNPKDSPVYRQEFLPARGQRSAQDEQAYQLLLEKQRAASEAGAAAGSVSAQESNPISQDSDDEQLTAEDLFYDRPPLSRDMFVLEPQQHESTLIWLPDSFETQKHHRSPFHMLSLQHLRVVVPSPPLRECTLVGGDEQTAWYDVISHPYSPQTCNSDFIGFKASMYQVHELIRDEAILMGEAMVKRVRPDIDVEMLDLELLQRLGSHRVFIGGFGQGGVMSIFAGTRFGKKLGGIISHSGYYPFVNETSQVATQIKQQQQQQPQNDTQSSVDNLYDISNLNPAPNLQAPLFVMYNQNDDKVGWLDVAQPSYISAMKSALRPQIVLRKSVSSGHSIGHQDLYQITEWCRQQASLLDVAAIPPAVFQPVTLTPEMTSAIATEEELAALAAAKEKQAQTPTS